MKKITKSIKIIALFTVLLAIPSLAKAQVVNKAYFNVDWQLNLPMGNSFADVFSGWGMHTEAGYFVTPNISLGAFLSYHTNNKYIGRQTIALSPTASINTDQQHSIFQLPFGGAFRYTFVNPSGTPIEPYIGAKIGANYSEVSSTTDIVEVYDSEWGLYLSPEIGLNIYPNPSKKIGIHVATYYNYSTNKSHVLGYDVDGLSNWGVRVGVAF